MAKFATDIDNRFDAAFPCVGRKAGEETRTVSIGDATFGGDRFVVIAGPCAVESAEQIELAAQSVVDAGGAVLRGGAFKPRTSPYSFQGLGLEGVELLRRASLRAGVPFVTEVLSPDDVEAMAPRVDAFQVGTRNMQNFALLAALGAQDKPVLLKRGFGATLHEWLHAAEHIASAGNESIILCERGIRSFGDETRFVLDIGGALWAQRRSNLPVVVDPSHGTGDPDLVVPLARAAVAAGLDGVMVEVHPSPEAALSDGDQALTMDQFRKMMAQLEPIAAAVGRGLNDV